MIVLGLLVATALSGLLVYYLLSRVRMCDGRAIRARYPPIDDVLTSEPAVYAYDLRNLALPPVKGLLFKLLVRIGFSRLGQWTIVPRLADGANFARMGGIYLPEFPTLYPTPRYPPPIKDDYAPSNRDILLKLLNQGEKGVAGFRFPTIADYRRAYKSGQCTPTDVAKATMKAVELSNSLHPPLRAIVDTDHSVVLAMAEASTERWRVGKTLSLLDGIPVSIKGMFRVEPYEFLGGCATSPYINQRTREAAIVRKLKEAGAVIIGIANLQEFGMGALGSNPNSRHLTARNAYNTQFYCGGSSSGSGVCVAAGLCPVSIGTDGGGSVRIPAALCGVVGLKHTYGLVDMSGCCAVSHSVGVSGPLCSSVLDAAITMDCITRETNGERVLMSLDGIDDDVSGMKVGVYWDYFNHADSEIVDKCKAALSVLESLGVEIVEIGIPELEASRVAHLTSIVSEMSQSLAPDTDQTFSDMNLESLMVICCGIQLTANNYLNAQKQRTRAMTCLRHIFEKVDAIVTPTTACVAPPISPTAVPLGEIDGTSSGKLMRFVFLANLCGNPAVTIPVGYTNEQGLPIGLQLMGRHYEERVMLCLGLALEQSGQFPLKKPQVFYDLLNN